MTVKIDEVVTGALVAIMEDAKSSSLPSQPQVAAKKAVSSGSAHDNSLHTRLCAAIKASWHILGECADNAPFLYDIKDVAGVASPGLVYSLKRLMRALAAPEQAVQTACASALEALLLALRTNVFPTGSCVAPAILGAWMATALSKTADSKHGALSPSHEAARRRGVIIGCRILLGHCSAEQKFLSPTLLGVLLDVWCDSEPLGIECLDIVSCAVSANDKEDMLVVLKNASTKRQVSHARRAALAIAAWTMPLLCPNEDTLPQRACDVISDCKDAVALLRRLSLRSDRPGQLAPGAPELWAMLVPRVLLNFGADAALSVWEAVLSCVPPGSEGLCEYLLHVLVRANCAKLFTLPLFALVRAAHTQKSFGPSVVNGIVDAAVVSCSLPDAAPEDIACALAGVSTLSASQPIAIKAATALLASSNVTAVLSLLASSRAYREALRSILPALLRTVRREHIAASPELGNSLAVCVARAYCAHGAGPDASIHLQSSLARLISVSPSAFDAVCALVDSITRIPSPGTIIKRVKRTLLRIDAILESARGMLSEHAYTFALRGEHKAESLDSQGLLPHNSRCDDSAVLCCVVRVASVARAAALIDSVAAKDVVRDLRRCVRNARRKPDAVCDALVEVLLLWLSRSSAAMRELSDACLAYVLPVIVSSSSKPLIVERPWVQSVLRILSTAPSSADHEDMLCGDSDDESNCDADRPPMPKRIARQDSTSDSLIMHSSSREQRQVAQVSSECQTNDEKSKRAHQCSEEGSSSEDEVIGDENEAELAAFDEKIAAVLAARREHASSRTMATRDLIVLKQRILDWLPLIDRETSRSSSAVMDLWRMRLAFAVAVADITSLHAPSPAVKSAERSSKRSAADAELVEKAFGVVVGRRSRLAPLPDTRFDGPVLPAQDVVLETIRALCARAQSATCVRFRVATALFWMLCGAAEVAKPCAKPFWDAAIVIVASLSRRTDNGPQSMLAAFLERPLATHAPAAAALLGAAWDTMHMGDARPFVRCRVVRTVDTVLQRTSRAPDSCSWALVAHTAALYSRISSSTPAHLRDDIAAMHGVVARSRQHGNISEWRVLWEPVVDRFSAAIDACPQADAQQRTALAKRLATTRALFAK